MNNTAEFLTNNKRFEKDHNIAVCLTAYNECGEYIAGSLCSLISNFSTFSSQVYSHGSVQATICLILDGVEDASDSLLEILESIGFEHNLREVDLYKPMCSTLPIDQSIIDYLCLKFDQRIEKGRMSWLESCDYSAADFKSENFPSREKLSLDLMLYIKPKNKGKLDSHWHFFRRILPSLKSEYCIQLDAGTVPQAFALCIAVEHLEANPNVAAAASRTYIPAPDSAINLIHLWQYIDFLNERFVLWPAEVASGYLSVIPGQLSIIRTDALESIWSENSNQTPSIYFDGLNSTGGLLKQSMHLAEDRVLGCEIAHAEGSNWKIDYSPDSIALTDPCESWSELLLQRRRWICSTLACKLWAIRKISSRGSRQKELSSRNSAQFKISAPTYLAMSVLFQWLLLATILGGYVGLYLTTSEALKSWGQELKIAYDLLAMLLMLTFTIKACYYNCYRKGKSIDKITSVSIGVQVTYILISAIAILFHPEQRFSVFLFFGVSAAYLAFLLVAIRHFCKRTPKTAIKFLVQYSIATLPIQVCTNVYALMNIDDLSWGTKGKTEKNTEKAKVNSCIFGGATLIKTAYLLSAAGFIYLCFLCNLIDGFNLLMLPFGMSLLNSILAIKFLISENLPRVPVDTVFHSESRLQEL